VLPPHVKNATVIVQHVSELTRIALAVLGLLRFPLFIIILVSQRQVAHRGISIIGLVDYVLSVHQLAKAVLVLIQHAHTAHYICTFLTRLAYSNVQQVYLLKMKLIERVWDVIQDVRVAQTPGINAHHA